MGNKERGIMSVGKDFFCNTYEFKLENFERKSEDCFFSGYASIFNVIDSHNDIIIDGAFSAINQNEVIPLLWQHDPSNPIGKIAKIKQDGTGLHVIGELCMEVKRAEEISVLLKKRIISGLSIGYSPVEYDFDFDNTTNRRIRKIKSAILWEVSLVTFPANKGAQIIDLYNGRLNNNKITQNNENSKEKLNHYLL